MEKKYELVKEDKIEWLGRTLYRIRALKDFGDVKKGDIGGYVEKEENLSQEGTAWVYGSATVCDSARVCGSATVYDSAVVYGSAMVCDSATVYGSAMVYGSATVCGSARIKADEDYMFFGSFGSMGRTTTIYRTETGCEVKCRCFKGTLDEFRAKVKETHGDSLHAREYLAIADIAEMRFGRRENDAADRS